MKAGKANPEPENIARFVDLAGKWTSVLNEEPGFRAHSRARLNVMLFPDETPESEWPQGFRLSPEREKQHALITSFFHLHDALEALRQCEVYFRRYPFRGTPVSKADHIRNVCEMYFGKFYVIRSRIKKCLNHMNDFSKNKADIGKFLKEFDRIFDQELRTRNLVNHHETFSDLKLDELIVTRLLTFGSGDSVEMWKQQHDDAYRKTARTWATRARKRAQSMSIFVDAVARALIDQVEFLSDAKAK